MATRFMFTAPTLLQKLTDIYWHRHIISFDYARNRWTKTAEPNKLKLFFFVNFIVIPIFGTGSVLFALIKYFLLKNHFVSTFIVCIWVALLLLSGFGWGFNLPAARWANNLIVYANTLLDFQDELIYSRPHKHSKIGHKIQNRHLRNLLSKTHGIKNFMADVSGDKIGAFLIIITIYLQLIGFLLPIAGIVFQFDPFVYIFRESSFFSCSPLILQTFLRYLLSQACVLDTARTFSIFLIGCLTSFNVTFRLIMVLQNTCVSLKSVGLYNQLWIIHWYGSWMLNYSNSVFLFLGFFLCVMFNCFTVVGWKVFPLPFYLTCVPITFLIHFLIHVGIPICVRCHDKSYELIKFKWVSELSVKTCTGSISIRNKKILQKMLLALTPITFYSGNLATLDHETRLSYLEYISESTSDTLMLFQTLI